MISINRQSSARTYIIAIVGTLCLIGIFMQGRSLQQQQQLGKIRILPVVSTNKRIDSEASPPTSKTLQEENAGTVSNVLSDWATFSFGGNVNNKKTVVETTTPPGKNNNKKPNEPPPPLKYKKSFIGFAFATMPRQDGQHWNTLLDNIPEGFPVTVVSRHKHRLQHPRITELVHLTGPPNEYDEKWLGRPLKLNFGDSVEMVKWRSGIILDMNSAMRAALNHSYHIVWFEDDVILNPGWFEDVLKIISLHANRGWSMFHISTWYGCVGMLFNGRFAREYFQYLYDRFDEEPLDWMIEKSLNEMRFPPNKKYNHNRQYRFAIVGHKGKVSTFGNRARNILNDVNKNIELQDYIKFLNATN